MYTELVSISRLIIPLNRPTPQNPPRQLARAAASSDRDVDWRGAEFACNIFAGFSVADRIYRSTTLPKKDEKAGAAKAE
jgi:hypothetical protein